MKAEKTLLELWLDEIDTPNLDAEGKQQVAEARLELNWLKTYAAKGLRAEQAEREIEAEEIKNQDETVS